MGEEGIEEEEEEGNEAPLADFLHIERRGGDWKGCVKSVLIGGMNMVSY